MTGAITLTESDGTTTYTVDVAIKVNIPLVGGKIEGLISDMLRKALLAEGTVGQRLPVALTLGLERLGARGPGAGAAGSRRRAPRTARSRARS